MEAYGTIKDMQARGIDTSKLLGMNVASAESTENMEGSE